MKRTLLSSAVAAIVAPTLCLFTVAAPRAQSTAVVDTKNAIEIQTSGPVHEAFAQPATNQVQPGPLVNKQPPPAVPEQPPQEQPDGANVQWTNGYWAWDAQQNEFIWVTGTYRNMPPGMRFVAGYWQQTPDGWRWVPGFFVPDGQQQVPLVPEPPPSLETGPVGPPPNANSIYIPGNWAYNNNQYAWQPGFYSGAQAGLVWCPPRYQWTPAGCLFIRGFWDHAPLGNRGFLFAPVAFRQPLWNTPGWQFRPSHVVGAQPLLASLWVQPRSGHYFFGNYYGANFARAGFQPWHTFGPSHHDPLFNYYRWQNRGNPQWATGLAQTHQDRVAGRLPLPPNTLVQQNTLVNAGNNTLRMVNTLGSQNVRLQTASQLNATKVQAQQSQALAQARRQQELAASQALKGGQVTAKSLNLAAAPRGNNTVHAANVNQATLPKTTAHAPNVNQFTLPKTTVHQPTVAPRATVQQPVVRTLSTPNTLPARPLANPVGQPHLNNVNSVRPFAATNSNYHAPAIQHAPVVRSAPVMHAPAIRSAPVMHAPAVHHAAPAHRGGGGGHHR